MADKTKEPADKGMIRVLVYGTLKEGHSNHTLIEQAGGIFVGYDSITGPYQLFDLGAIPAVVDSADTGNRRIRGEIWAIGPEGLASLDMLEGHPHLYQRRKLFTDIHERRAWIYMLMAPNFMTSSAEEKKCGVWNPSKKESAFWIKQSAKKVASA